MRLIARIRDKGSPKLPFRLAALTAILGLLVALPQTSEADAEAEAKYPFDPACAWGRLANGKGMLHRCLTKEEAGRVAREEKRRRDESISASDCDKKDVKCLKKAKKKTSPGSDLPSDENSLPQRREFRISVGPIAADKGDIKIGRLAKPLERYRECVEKNGGLRKEKAKVVIKFLVRAERVRAEGVSVESSDGVSRGAAKCIANVVDRRKVGIPAVPITAARLTFTIAQQK